MPRKISSIQSPFITKILNELNALRVEVEAIKQQMGEVGPRAGRVGGGGQGMPDILKTQYYKYHPTGEDMSDEDEMATTRYHAMSTVSMIGAARRAMFGYAMLLDKLGLPKEQKQTVKSIEAVISGAMRLMQTMKMVQYSMAAFEAGMGPVGWVYLAMAGGTAAASMMYGNKALGGAS